MPQQWQQQKKEGGMKGKSNENKPRNEIHFSLRTTIVSSTPRFFCYKVASNQLNKQPQQLSYQKVMVNSTAIRREATKKSSGRHLPHAPPPITAIRQAKQIKPGCVWMFDVGQESSGIAEAWDSNFNWQQHKPNATAAAPATTTIAPTKTSSLFFTNEC